MSSSNNVILVDESDNIIGTEEKILAHRLGLLHRAFSVIVYQDIYDDKDVIRKFLLQKRSNSKYHSKMLWSNTCCSHPKPNEDMGDSVNRRLREEMGISANISLIKKQLYYLKLDNNMIEHEFDHIFCGQISFPYVVDINKEEVDSYMWVTFDMWNNWYRQKPHEFTAWSCYIIDALNENLSHIPKTNP